MSPKTARRRARILLLCYPRAWRARYGEEFAELLAADLDDRPRSASRTADVVRAGLRARLASAGLADHPLDPDSAGRAGLAVLTCSGVAIGVFGGAIWSQLATGIQWAVPGNPGIRHAMSLMTAALLLFVVIAVLAAAPVIWSAIVMWVRGSGGPLRGPSLLALAAAVVLVVGGRHFENGWPGTGGHLLAQQALVPPGVAAFAWATTLWVSSYWVHPAMLTAFSPGQLAWMLACPAALVALVTGLAQLARRLEQSPRLFRYQVLLGRLAGISLAAFCAGALGWLVEASTGVPPFLHAGAIDEAALAVLAVAFGVGARAMRFARLRCHPA